jgi:hypothetical protein
MRRPEAVLLPLRISEISTAKKKKKSIVGFGFVFLLFFLFFSFHPHHVGGTLKDEGSRRGGDSDRKQCP